MITDKMVEAACETYEGQMAWCKMNAAHKGARLADMKRALQAAQSASPPPSADDAPAGERSALIRHAIKLMQRESFDGMSFSPELSHTLKLLAAASSPSPDDDCDPHSRMIEDPEGIHDYIVPAQSRGTPVADRRGIVGLIEDLASCERALGRRTEERNKFAAELRAARAAPDAPRSGALPAVTDGKVLNAPDRVYLNVGALLKPVEFAELQRSGEVSWCHDKIDHDDVEYVRADLAVPRSGDAPVAWRYRYFDPAAGRDVWKLERIGCVQGQHEPLETQPLYTTPVSAPAQAPVEVSRDIIREAIGLLDLSAHRIPVVSQARELLAKALSAPADARDGERCKFIAERVTEMCAKDYARGREFEVTFNTPGMEHDGAWVSSPESFLAAIDLALAGRMGKDGINEVALADRAMGAEGGG